MHDARSGNSFGDEIPAPGGLPDRVSGGGKIKPGVSWTSDTRVGGVSGLVDLFRTTFVFGINSSGHCSSTRQFFGQTVRRGTVRCSVCWRGAVGVWVSYL